MLETELSIVLDWSYNFL